jgi:TRAP-type mannitol/chloroaromatic compound transport system substrate-binding protein
MSDESKELFVMAVKLTQFWHITDLQHKNMVAWEKMIDEGLKVTKASPEFQAWMTKKGDELAEKYAAKDPWAKKCLDSQKAYRDRYEKFAVHSVWFR